MSSVLATIVVVPREQFSRGRLCLDALRERTEGAHPLVYVDGNSPRPFAGELARRADRGELTLARTEHYLPGNVARNLGLAHVHTKYVAFLDNDVLVWPGWLSALIRCAEETGAWVVGPLYCIGGPESEVVHTSGADLAIVEMGGHRRLHERHLRCEEPAAVVRAEVARTRRDEVEFHCLLARTDLFDRLGPLDEALLSYFDHLDFCLGARRAGGTIWIDCAATVTYLVPPPIAWADLPYFLLRWSATWYQSSRARFCATWGLDPDDPAFADHEHYRRAHRARLLSPLSPVSRLLEPTLGRYLESTLVRDLERSRIAAGCGTDPR
ncbi:MAG: glycosyltransferase [Deltaproteobacteria bacterium]|nr:glycosyltransferase [Deltaproteobacteria bacterium]